MEHFGGYFSSIFSKGKKTICINAYSLCWAASKPRFGDQSIKISAQID
jgi:hypothetical protein